MFKTLRTWLVAAGVMLLAACGGGGDDHPPDIVSLAKADSRFSILAEAITAAGLTGNLQGPGPFTVFAPTNDAFAALLTEPARPARRPGATSTDSPAAVETSRSGDTRRSGWPTPGRGTSNSGRSWSEG
jgi:hypothetical protein